MPSLLPWTRMGFFSKAKDLYKLQREAKQVKKQLQSIHVEAECRGVTVVVSANSEVVSITIADEVPREEIASRLLDALNRALRKVQVVAAEKTRGLMGDFGLPTGA